jgi:hypothetical protein
MGSERESVPHGAQPSIDRVRITGASGNDVDPTHPNCFTTPRGHNAYSHILQWAAETTNGMFFLPFKFRFFRVYAVRILHINAIAS